MSEPAGPAPQPSEPPPGRQADPLLKRGLGVPWLFAAAYSAVGFSIYFALGVVADRGLGLTPLIFLAAGLLFGLTTLSYVEGGAMFRERGGSSTFARHAFNELIAFIAGWAILIDYLIVIALAAISVPHYLEPIWGGFSRPGWEIGVAAAVIAAACVLNILNVTGRERAALAGAAGAGRPRPAAGGDRRRRPRRPASRPPDRAAPPLLRPQLQGHRLRRRGGDARLRRDRGRLRPRARHRRRPPRPEADRLARRDRGAARLRRDGGDRADGGAGGRRAARARDRARQHSSSRSRCSGWSPPSTRTGSPTSMRWMVALVAAPVLFWAANTSMLGVSRHIYTLAINRQIPSWLGKLERRKATPYVAIAISGVDRARPGDPDQRQAAGRHLRLRRHPGDHDRPPLDHPPAGQDPDRRRPFKIPMGIPWRGAELPLPAIVAAILSGLAFVSVLVYHDIARLVGGGWMVFGLIFYVVYRKVFEGTTLTKRVSVTERALTKQVPEVEFRNILVPGLRDQARRRHRRHRRPPRRGRAGGVRQGRGRRPARRRST